MEKIIILITYLLDITKTVVVQSSNINNSNITIILTVSLSELNTIFLILFISILFLFNNCNKDSDEFNSGYKNNNFY